MNFAIPLTDTQISQSKILINNRLRVKISYTPDVFIVPLTISCSASESLQSWQVKIKNYGRYEEGLFAGAPAQILWSGDAEIWIPLMTGLVSEKGMTRTIGHTTDDYVTFTVEDPTRNRGTKRKPKKSAYVGKKISDPDDVGNSLVHILAGTMSVGVDAGKIPDVKDIIVVGDDTNWSEIQRLAEAFDVNLVFDNQGRLRFRSYREDGWTEPVVEWTLVANGSSVPLRGSEVTGQISKNFNAVTCNKASTDFENYMQKPEQVIYRNTDNWNSALEECSIVIQAGNTWPAQGVASLSYKDPSTGEEFPYAVDVRTPTIGQNKNFDICWSGTGNLILVSFNGSTSATSAGPADSQIILQNIGSGPVTVTKFVVRGRPFSSCGTKRVYELDSSVLDEVDVVEKTVDGKYFIDLDQASKTLARYRDRGKAHTRRFSLSTFFMPCIQRGMHINLVAEDDERIECRVVSYEHRMNGRTMSTLRTSMILDETAAYEAEYHPGVIDWSRPQTVPQKGAPGQDGKDGTDGADGKLLRLTGDGPVFRLDKDGNPYPGQVITLDALKQGIADELNWHIPDHGIPAGTTEVRLTPADMGHGKVTLTNIISNSSEDWETGEPGSYVAGDMYYSPPLVVGHKYYWRCEYKYTTTDQSPVWAAIHTQHSSAVAGDILLNPVSGTEYVLSGAKSAEEPYQLTVGRVYNGPSDAINGVSGSTKNEMCVDLTELISLYPQKLSGMTDSQISAWCDTYIPYIKSGESWTIGGTLRNVLDMGGTWDNLGVSSYQWNSSTGIMSAVTADSLPSTVSYMRMNSLSNGVDYTWYMRNSIKQIGDVQTKYENLGYGGISFLSYNNRKIEVLSNSFTTGSLLGIGAENSLVRFYLFYYHTSFGQYYGSSSIECKEAICCDLVYSGWLAQLSLYGIEGADAVGKWMDSIPYFSDSMEFPVLESLPVTVTAGEYSDGTTISIVRDGKEGLNASFARYAYKAASSVPPTPSGDSSSVPAGWDESVPVRDAGQTIYVTVAVTTWDVGNVPSYGPWSAPSPWSGDKGDTGAPVVDFSLSAGMSTYAMSSRNVVKAAQTVTFACDRQNTSGAVTWSVNRGLTVTPSSDGATATVTIPVGFGYTSFTVTCAVEGVGTKTVQINGVPSGTYAPMFLGKLETAPTTTAEGPLMAGDSYLTSGNVPQRWDGYGWNTPTASDSNYAFIMSQSLNAVLADGTDVTRSMASLYAWIGELAAKSATIQRLFAKNVTVGNGDGTASSGFRFRAHQYDANGNILAAPIFDIMYGDKTVWKVVPSTGKIFFGQPNAALDAPLTGFMYDPETETIRSAGDKTIIGADGILETDEVCANNAKITGNSVFAGLFNCVAIKTSPSQSISTTYTQAGTANQTKNLVNSIGASSGDILRCAVVGGNTAVKYIRIETSGYTSSGYHTIDQWKIFFLDEKYSSVTCGFSITDTFNSPYVPGSVLISYRGYGVWVTSGITLNIYTGGNNLVVNIPSGPTASEIANFEPGQVYRDSNGFLKCTPISS